MLDKCPALIPGTVPARQRPLQVVSRHDSIPKHPLAHNAHVTFLHHCRKPALRMLVHHVMEQLSACAELRRAARMRAGKGERSRRLHAGEEVLFLRLRRTESSTNTKHGSSFA